MGFELDVMESHYERTKELEGVVSTLIEAKQLEPHEMLYVFGEAAVTGAMQCDMTKDEAMLEFSEMWDLLVIEGKG